MKPMGIAVAILLLVLAGILFSSPKGGVPGAGQFEIVGRTAPDFVLSGMGNTWHLSDHLGKPMIISFWTTWCGVCLHDLDVLEEFRRRYGDRFEVVSVCPEHWDRVPGILRTHPVGFPVLYDPGGKVAQEYERLEHLRYPFTVFVDAGGRARCVWAYGFRDLGHLMELLDRCGLR